MTLENINIRNAELEDLSIILSLQKKAYLSEARIYNDYTIPPLTQDINSITEEFNQGVILKAVNGNTIIGSIRAYQSNGTCFIGKLIVDKDFQNNGIGLALIKRIEEKFMDVLRHELFTGNKSEKNLFLYKKIGYNEFSRRMVNENLTLIYLEKFVVRQ
jgi:N-acetylglutamate synthase-like GNAT family acetyltransferase